MDYKTKRSGDGVTDLDTLKTWAEEWFHISEAANQTRHLFEELDAANRIINELRAPAEVKS